MALTDNLISCWELEEASGTRFDAVVASANDLADNNTVTQNTGKVNNAAEFTNANDEFLSKASNASLQLGDIDFTFCLWVYLNSKPENMHMYSKSTGVYNEVEIRYELSLNRFAIDVWKSGQSIAQRYFEDIGVSTATWYFLAAWYDAAADELSCSINDGSVLTTTGVTTLDSVGTADINIGRYGATSDNHWDGRLDQICFWKRKLSSSEITQMFNSGNGLSYAQMNPVVSPKYLDLIDSINNQIVDDRWF